MKSFLKLTRLRYFLFLALLPFALPGQDDSSYFRSVSGDQNKKEHLNTILKRSEEFIKEGNFGNALEGALFVYGETDTTDLYEQRGSALNKISAIHYTLGDYEKSLQTLLQLVDLCHNTPELNNRERGVFVNLGLLYQETSNRPEAFKYYNKALYWQGDSSYWAGAGNIRLNMGELFLEENNLEQAEKNLFKSIAIFQKEAKNLKEASAMLEMARLEAAKGFPAKGLKNIEIAENLANGNQNFDFLLKLSKIKGEVYFAAKQFEKAYESQDLHYHLKDSIYYSDRQKLALRWTAMYEGEKKDREIQKLQKNRMEDELLLSQSNGRVTLFIGITIVLFVLAFFLTLRIRNKRKNTQALQKLNEELQKKKDEISRQNEAIRHINAGLEEEVRRRTNKLSLANKELDTFLYQSSHALRRPLMQFSGLLKLGDQEGSNAEAQQTLRLKMEQTIEKMDSMLRKLSEVSQIVNRTPQFWDVDLPHFIQDVWSIIQERYPNIKTQLILKGLPPKIKQDPYLLGIILEAVLENAFFFSKDAPNPQTEVWVESSEDSLKLFVRDNGPGIPGGHEANAFKMFWVGHVDGPGQGLGLFIAKKSVDVLDGNIELKNMAGTQVCIELPNPA